MAEFPFGGLPGAIITGARELFDRFGRRPQRVPPLDLPNVFCEGTLCTHYGPTPDRTRAEFGTLNELGQFVKITPPPGSIRPPSAPAAPSAPSGGGFIGSGGFFSGFPLATVREIERAASSGLAEILRRFASLNFTLADLASAERFERERKKKRAKR